MKWARAGAKYALPCVLLVVAAVVIGSQARRPAAVLEMLRPWAEVGVIAVPMTAIVLTGGIDLSVGSIVALCGIATGLLWQQGDWPIQWAALGGVVVGLMAGATNGTLVVSGISPLVATLATMAFFRGLAMALSQGQRIAGLPPVLNELGQGDLLGVGHQFWLLGTALLVGWALVHHSRYGRYLYAIGDNRQAARVAAVPVRRVEWWLYALSGLVAGVVAVFYMGRGGAAIPDAGRWLELQAIACVVLGGTNITGGVGGVGRTMLGIAVMAGLDTALQFVASTAIYLPWRDEPWYLSAENRLIVVGALLIAVAVWNERLAAGAGSVVDADAA